MANGPIQPVAIFWDIENCPVPKGMEADHVCTNVYMALNAAISDGRHVKMFAAYGNVTKVKSQIKEGCQNSGAMFIDVPSGRKEAADNAILVDMFSFALSHPPPSTILLISGDVDFAPALHKLGQRGYTMMTAIPSGVKVASALLNACKYVLDWPSIARGEIPRFGFTEPEGFHSQGHVNPRTWREAKAQSAQFTFQMNKSAVSYQMVESFASQNRTAATTYLPPVNTVQSTKRTEREGIQFHPEAWRRNQNENDILKPMFSEPERHYSDVNLHHFIPKDVLGQSTERSFKNVSNQMVISPYKNFEAGATSARPVNFIQNTVDMGKKNVQIPAETILIRDHLFRADIQPENLNSEVNIDSSWANVNHQPAAVHPDVKMENYPLSNRIVNYPVHKLDTCSLTLANATGSTKGKKKKEQDPPKAKVLKKKKGKKTKASMKNQSKRTGSTTERNRQRQALEEMIGNCLSMGILGDHKAIEIVKDRNDPQSKAIVGMGHEYAPWHVLSSPAHGVGRPTISAHSWTQPDMLMHSVTDRSVPRGISVTHGVGKPVLSAHRWTQPDMLIHSVTVPSVPLGISSSRAVGRSKISAHNWPQPGMSMYSVTDPSISSGIPTTYSVRRPTSSAHNWTQPDTLIHSVTDPSVPLGPSLASAGHAKQFLELPQNYTVKRVPNSAARGWSEEYQNDHPGSYGYFSETRNMNISNPYPF